MKDETEKLIDAMEARVRREHPDAEILPSREYYALRIYEWVETLAAAGMAIVPLEATEAMRAAGVNVVSAAWDFPLKVTPEGVQLEAYRQMVAARPLLSAQDREADGTDA